MFFKPKCPSCGKPWINGNRTCECGYSLRVLVCPRCLDYSKSTDFSNRKHMLNYAQSREYGGDNCNAVYVEVDMGIDECGKLELEVAQNTPSLSDLPSPYREFVYDYQIYLVRKELYDRLKDKSSVEPGIIFSRFYRHDLPENQEFFLKHYKHTYDELMSAISSEETLTQLKEEKKLADEEYRKRQAEKAASQPHRPTCPICHSTNLTRISVGKRAVKTAVFGIVGALDDSGKTWKCNNCGSKF